MWQRAEVRGRVRAPKLDSDAAKLATLCKHCRRGDFREVRAIVAHYPYLLALTDASGFGPLNHAEISGDSRFVAQLLELYRNPRTFALKVVRYESEEEWLRDERCGFELRLVSAASAASGGGVGPGPGGGGGLGEGRQTLLVVEHAGNERSLSAAAGLLPGDVLEAVSSGDAQGPAGAAVGPLEAQPPSGEDLWDVLHGRGRGRGEESRYPMSLVFRGSASAQMLLGDGWTPCHGAAGNSARPGSRRILAQLLREEAGALASQDVGGCTPADWYQLSMGTNCRQQRPRPSSSGAAAGLGRAGGRKSASRPLSAAPRTAMLARDLQEGVLRRPPLASR